MLVSGGWWWLSVVAIVCRWFVVPCYRFLGSGCWWLMIVGSGCCYSFLSGDRWLAMVGSGQVNCKFIQIISYSSLDSDSSRWSVVVGGGSIRGWW